MYKVKAVVEGVGRGLMMHKFGVAAQIEVGNKVRQAGSANKVVPEVEAEQGAYRLEPKEGEAKGQLCLPAEHFLGAMTGAASSFQQKGRGKKTYKDNFKGAVEVRPDYLGLTDDQGKPVCDYAIDSRPVRVQKGRIIRHRPFFKPGWRTEFEIEVMDDTIPLEVVQAVLEEAGRSKCVGDYRPRFGQFRIVSLDKAKEAEAA